MQENGEGLGGICWSSRLSAIADAELEACGQRRARPLVRGLRPLPILVGGWASGRFHRFVVCSLAQAHLWV